MGLLDGLFGSSTNPTVTTQDKTSTSLPSWYQQYLNAILGKASSVAAEPYQPYTSPRIAPTSGDTTAAYNQVRSGIGAYQPTLNAAQGVTANAANPNLNTGTFSSYFNPYVGGVVDRIGELAGRNLGENLLPQVNDSFIKAGQFGSSRNQDFTLRALRDTQESALAQQNQALAQGFDSQMQNYNAGMDRSLNAGQQLGSLAQLGQGMNLQDAAALQGIGQSQEDKTQQSLNLGYQDFLEQRDYPRNQVDWFSSILRGYNPGTTTTSTSTAPATSSQLAPNSLSQLAGSALGIYGLTNGFQFRRGGKVHRKHPPVVKKGIPKMREKPAPVIDMEEMPEAGAGGISQWKMAA